MSSDIHWSADIGQVKDTVNFANGYRTAEYVFAMGRLFQKRTFIS
jgi:hypothetical protein